MAQKHVAEGYDRVRAATFGLASFPGFSVPSAPPGGPCSGSRSGHHLVAVRRHLPHDSRPRIL